MKMTFDWLIAVGLSTIYFFGIATALGYVAGMDLPWHPLKGKPAWEVYALLSFEDLATVFAVSSAVAAGIALRFPGRAFTIGLVVAAPTALYSAWDILRVLGVGPVSGVDLGVEIAQSVVLLFAPAGLSLCFARLISNHLIKPTANAAA